MVAKKLTGYIPPQPGYKRISKQSLVDSVDPEIHDVMYELLLNGFITNTSCAGHIKHGEKPYLIKQSSTLEGEKQAKQYYVTDGMGYIVFSQSGFNELLAKQILTKHGLKGLRSIKVIVFRKPHIVILFNAIGVKQTPKYLKNGGAEGAMWESAYVGTGITW